METFEVGDRIQVRKVDKSQIIDGNYPVTLGWIEVTKKTSKGGSGYWHGIVSGRNVRLGLIKFENKEVQKNEGKSIDKNINS